MSFVIEDKVYCTWSYRATLPNWLQVRFGDLDDLLRQLIISAETSLTIVAPYLSAPGFQLLARALSTCSDRRVGVRIVTQIIGDTANRIALEHLMTDLRGTALSHRLRVLSTGQDLFIHAKVLIADGTRGYIGSANVSVAGLEKNLEFGVPLSFLQAQALDEFVDHLEASRVLSEVPVMPSATYQG